VTCSSSEFLHLYLATNLIVVILVIDRPIISSSIIIIVIIIINMWQFKTCHLTKRSRHGINRQTDGRRTRSRPVMHNGMDPLIGGPRINWRQANDGMPLSWRSTFASGYLHATNCQCRRWVTGQQFHGSAWSCALNTIVDMHTSNQFRRRLRRELTALLGKSHVYSMLQKVSQCIYVE